MEKEPEKQLSESRKEESKTGLFVKIEGEEKEEEQAIDGELNNRPDPENDDTDDAHFPPNEGFTGDPILFSELDDFKQAYKHFGAIDEHHTIGV